MRFFALILLLLLTGALGLPENVEDSINEGENEVGETSCSSTTAPGVICQMSVYSIWYRKNKSFVFSIFFSGQHSMELVMKKSNARKNI